MSYILDALKKSDQERQQGSTPNLYVAHGPIPQMAGRSQSRRWQIVIISIFTILLLFGCTVLFLMKSDRPAQEQPVEQLSAAPRVKKEQDRPATAPAPAVTSEKADDPVAQKIVIKTTSEEPTAALSAEEPSATGTAQDLESKQPPLLSDLSPALQTELPELSFAAHTYAEEPGQRMIIVNGKILRQGSLIAPGIRLEEITWEGVVLNYRGTVFQIKTN